MDPLTTVVNLVLHLDQSLRPLAEAAGPWIYALLFLVVFAETGFVVTPFLPGDSLLFMVGTLCGAGVLDGPAAALTLMAAAILGDTVNYHAGRWIGPRVLVRTKGRWIKPEYLAAAQRFYERWGGRAVVLGRFVPVVRTFVPFVAGVGSMRYGTFLLFNVVGGTVWVAGFLTAGWALGGLAVVRGNLGWFTLVIVALSVVPVFAGWVIRLVRSPQKEPQ